MKRLISKFSDKLLSNQQLRTVKGGNYYCTCDHGGGGAPINTSSAAECSSLCGEGPAPKGKGTKTLAQMKPGHNGPAER